MMSGPRSGAFGRVPSGCTPDSEDTPIHRGQAPRRCTDLGPGCGRSSWPRTLATLGLPEPQLFAKRWFGLSHGRARELALNLSGAVGMAQHSDRCFRQLAACSVHPKAASSGKIRAHSPVGPHIPQTSLLEISHTARASGNFRFPKSVSYTSRKKRAPPPVLALGGNFLSDGVRGGGLAPIANFLSRVQGCHQSMFLLDQLENGSFALD